MTPAPSPLLPGFIALHGNRAEDLAQAAGITLHIENLYAENNHHRIESVFKAFAKALRMATELDPRAAGQLPSTKGAL